MNSSSIIILAVIISIADAAPADYEIVQGDIAVPKAFKSGLPHPFQLWPSSTLIYSFDASLPQSHRNAAQQAINIIQSRTCIRFKPRTRESDYVSIFHGHGCWSFIGRLRGHQQLSLGQGCHHLHVVVHEIMHALGVYHEHDRYDRDQYLTINWNNILPDQRYNFVKKDQGNSKNYRTRFDFQSVMLYDPRLWSSNGRNVLESKIPGQRMFYDHEKQNIADGDVELLNAMYCSGRSG